MDHVNTSFSQVRSDQTMSEFCTYPNGTLVFERETGKFTLMSTDKPYLDVELDHEIYNCYSTSKNTLAEMFEECKKFSKHGTVYSIDLWENVKQSDVEFNNEIIDRFIEKPVVLFKKEETK